MTETAPSVVWSLHRQGEITACEIAFVPTGTEVRIFTGSSLTSRTFGEGDDALQWAEAERSMRVQAGWLAID